MKKTVISWYVFAVIKIRISCDFNNLFMSDCLVQFYVLLNFEFVKIRCLYKNTIGISVFPFVAVVILFLYGCYSVTLSLTNNKLQNK